MKRLIKFNSEYFFSFLVLFNIEISIALFIKQPFVRYFLGDVLVVILMYCCIKSFLKADTNKTYSLPST